MKKILSFALAIAVLAVSSCKKDNAKPVEITEANLAGSYRIAAFTSQKGAAAPVDLIAHLEDCEKDNVVKFNTDHTYNYIDAGVQCNPPGDDHGTWSLPTTSQFILDSTTFSIKSFDGKTFIIAATETTGNEVTVYTYTFVKQ